MSVLELFVLPLLWARDVVRRWRQHRRDLAEFDRSGGVLEVPWHAATAPLHPPITWDPSFPLVGEGPYVPWDTQPPTRAEVAAGGQLRESMRAGEHELGGRVVAPDRPQVLLAVDQAAPFTIDRDVYEAAFDAVVRAGGVRLDNGETEVVVDFRGDRYGSPKGLPVVYVCPRCGGVRESIDVPDAGQAKPWPTIGGECSGCGWPRGRAMEGEPHVR